MQLSPLDSSAIVGYHYDAATKRLTVKPVWGDEKHFDDVPEWAVEQFVNAKSIGHYYHVIIRKHFKERDNVEAAATPSADD